MQMPNLPDGYPLTAGQLNAALRLETIFMPHALRQREQAGFGLEDEREPIRFAHYTSAEAALNIIRTKRFWMRSTTCMADYSEVLHGFAMLQSFFADQNKKRSFVAALDACHADVAEEAFQLFDAWRAEIHSNTYVAALSEHDPTEDTYGRLSMWRAFGGNSGRVALVLRIPKLSGAALALNISFNPVSYLSKDNAHAVLDEVVINIQRERTFLRTIAREQIVRTIFSSFVATAVCLKHEGFKEEREWRAIYSPNRSPSDWIELSTEVIGGIPQLVYKIPLDGTVAPVLADLDFVRLFDQLIIGPSAYPMAMWQAFVVELQKAGVADARDRVRVSDIPIRA